jgi:hypothetical protein
MKELPELIKLVKAWEVAINGKHVIPTPFSLRAQNPFTQREGGKDYPTTRNCVSPPHRPAVVVVSRGTRDAWAHCHSGVAG